MTPNAVNLGVKFQSDVAGYITGIRFYKGPSNTGTHVGHLWTASGALLATATFTNETASGWQQVNFANPVADHRQHRLRGLVLRPRRAATPSTTTTSPPPGMITHRCTRWKTG